MTRDRTGRDKKEIKKKIDMRRWEAYGIRHKSIRDSCLDIVNPYV